MNGLLVDHPDDGVSLQVDEHVQGEGEDTTHSPTPGTQAAGQTQEREIW